MLLSTMYKDSLIAINSDLYGGSFQIDEFNNVIDLINESFVKEKYDEYKAAGMSRQEIMSTKLMVALTTSSALTFAAGSANLPADFLFFNAIGYGASGSQYPVDLVEDDVWVKRQLNSITGPTVTHPIVRIEGVTIKILPSTITTTSVLYYIKEPTTPFLDYYIDANDNKVFLDAGATDVAVGAGCTTRTGVAGATTVDSATVELVFPEDLHSAFFHRILDLLAVRNRDQLTLQATMAKEQKEMI